jgi:hypothetical protein
MLAQRGKRGVMKRVQAALFTTMSMPPTPPDAAPQHLIREELARIEHSATFRQSDQLRALLRHLVVRTVAG